MKKLVFTFLCIFTLLISILSAMAVEPGVKASQVRPATFPQGEFTFVNGLYKIQSTSNDGQRYGLYSTITGSNVKAWLGRNIYNNDFSLFTEGRVRAISGDDNYHTFEAINTHTSYSAIKATNTLGPGNPTAYVGTYSEAAHFITGTGSRERSVILAATNGDAISAVGDVTIDGELDLQENMYADKNIIVEGYVQANGGVYGSGPDLAELIPSLDNAQPGDVVVIGNGENVRKSSKPFDTKVAGIISTKPGMVLNGANGNGVELALSGRVPVKVTNENGNIKPGDLLTTSSKKGYAMKCENRKECYGAIVGKAMGSLDKKEGQIIALVMLG